MSVIGVKNILLMMVWNCVLLAATMTTHAQYQVASWTTDDGLPQNTVHSILQTRDGYLWLATLDGLVRFDGVRFHIFNKQNTTGIESNRFTQLVTDATGDLWIGLENGSITRYHDGRFQTYTFAGIKARDGQFWFPTQGGVAVIDPRNIPFNAHPPPVVIETIKIDNEVLANEKPTIHNSPSAIEMVPGKNNLEIAYTGLSFVKPEFVKFRYKLEGLDADWVEAGERRTAYYSYLPPGEYVFTVIAANADGVWSTEGARVGVKVLPPFYRTWWFLISSFAFVVGAALLFYRRRVAQLEKEKAAQQTYSQQLIESQESERRRIAVELHDGLGQSLVVIKNRALISLNTPENHERLRSQMEEISEAASAAITEVRGIARNLHPYQIEYLGLTTALRTMVESIADASNIEFTTEIDTLDGELPKEAEINLYRIVQEALNNVVKHSAATRASVSLKKNGRVLTLFIEDNGKGFVLDAENGRRGLGLVGIGERAKMLNAQHEVRSTQGGGTKIYLQMPILESSNR